MIWLKPWLVLPIVAVAFLLANAQKCAVCPTGGAWTDWEEVGECSGFCGYMGRQNETRNCVSERYGCPCDGPSSRLIPCNRTLCLFPLHRCADGYKVGGPIDKLWVCVPIDPPTPDPLESQVPDPDWECTGRLVCIAYAYAAVAICNHDNNPETDDDNHFNEYNYYDHDHDHGFYNHHFNDDNNYYEYDYFHDYDDDDDNNEYDYYDDVDKYYYNNHHYDDDYDDDHDDHDDYYHYDNDKDNYYDYDHNNNYYYYYYDYFNDSDNYEKTLLPDHVRTRADVETRKRRSQDPALQENCYNPYNTTIQCTANMNLMATQKLYDKDRNVVRTLNYCTGANKAATIYCQRAAGNSDNYFISQQDQKSIGYFSCDVAWSAECA